MPKSQFFRLIKLCDQSFFCAKRGLHQASLDARPEECLKKQFLKASRGSWASETPGSRPAASQPACVSSAGPLAAARRRQRQLQQGLPALRADGHGVHGPQPLHVAVLRVEAPRRVRRRSEGARVRLHAPVGEVLVVLELVGVVLQDPELRGRLPLHVLGRAVHRLVGPRCSRAQSGRSTARPCAPPSWQGPSSASGCPGPPRRWRRSSGRFVRCTAFSGSFLSSVANSLPRSVVTTKLSSPVSSFAARLVARPTVSAFLFCRGSTAASRVKTSITTKAVLRLLPRVLAEVDEVGLQPVVGPLGGRLAQRRRPGPSAPGLRRRDELGHGLRAAALRLQHAHRDQHLRLLGRSLPDEELGGLEQAASVQQQRGLRQRPGAAAAGQPIRAPFWGNK